MSGDPNGLRRSLTTPIPQIFVAAARLAEAARFHEMGDRAATEACLKLADCDEVRAYTEAAWGKGAAARYGFLKLADAPPYLAVPDRPMPRMPDAAARRLVIARDGYHCRFCGIPVIDPAVRKAAATHYPAAVTWGKVNASQHAAFQCMWLQFDHILPNSRGGDSSLSNIVIACAACNFGRMEATIEEARLEDPLRLEAPVAWDGHASWTGLEGFRKVR